MQTPTYTSAELALLARARDKRKTPELRQSLKTDTPASLAARMARAKVAAAAQVVEKQQARQVRQELLALRLTKARKRATVAVLDTGDKRSRGSDVVNAPPQYKRKRAPRLSVSDKQKQVYAAFELATNNKSALSSVLTHIAHAYIIRDVQTVGRESTMQIVIDVTPRGKLTIELAVAVPKDASLSMRILDRIVTKVARIQT